MSLFLLVSVCGARYLPCRRSGCVSYRPLPLAQVAFSATGSVPIAPKTRFALPSGNRWQLRCCRRRDRRQAKLHRSFVFQLFEFGSSNNIKPATPKGVAGFMVPVTGLEPVRFLRRGILSPLCLPIPPYRRHGCYRTTFSANRQVLQLVEIQRKRG